MPHADADRPTRSLLVIAAPKEARAVLRGLRLEADSHIHWHARPLSARFDLLVTGVGKANAAAATARALDPARHDRVFNLGVAGALPGSGLAVADLVDADRCVYADEGSALPEPDRFHTIARMGFGPLADLCGPGNGVDAMSINCTPCLSAETLARLRVRVGPVATVSTCSGTDALALEIARRTAALAEDMESAAVGFTVARLAPLARFGCLRAISNTTGDRFAQSWNLDAALDALAHAAASL